MNSMSDKVFLDTNVLVYLFDRDAPIKQERARAILETEGRSSNIVISTQVLEEFYVSVTRKLRKPLPEGEAEGAVRDLTALEVVEVDVDMILRSIVAARRHKISLWDTLIVEAARARGCRRLLTEDLQDGQQFDDLRVENPFRTSAS